MTRLESAIRDNNTLRELKIVPDTSLPATLRQYFSEYTPVPVPVPASVAKAMLKGAARNKKLEKMAMTVPCTTEVHKLVDELKEVNTKLGLYVEYCEVRVCIC